MLGFLVSFFGGGVGVGGSKFFFFMQKKGAFKFTDQVNK